MYICKLCVFRTFMKHLNRDYLGSKRLTFDIDKNYEMEKLFSIHQQYFYGHAFRKRLSADVCVS